MKKIPILLFIFCTLVAKAQIGGQVTIDTTLFSIQEEEAYHRISFGESSVTGEVGKPELPVRYETYVLPFAAEVSGLQVSTMARRQIPGTYRIYPVQPPRTTNEEADTVAFVEPDPQVYGSAQPWPGKNAEIISDRYEQGYHLVTVKIYPVEYIPLTGELYVQDVIYNVNYTIGNGQNAMQAAKQSARRAELAKRAIKAIVKNPDAVDAFANPATAVVKRSTLIDPADTLAVKKTRASFKPSVLEELVPDYIIITSEALKPTFQRLADWKTKKGVPAIIKTIEEIEPAYPGCDTQEKIRYYLKDAYARWGAGLFILLGGDVNIVPARMLRTAKKRTPGLYFATDLYYTALDGTWNANKNNVFGETKGDETDFHGRDCYVGRAPVENMQEADIFIDKVLSYEKVEGITNTAYFNNSMAAKAYLSKNEETGLWGIIDSKSIRQIYEAYTPARVKPYFLFDNVNCDAGNCSNVNCGVGDLELTRDNFLSALNNGGNTPKAPFHIIYHMDHSSESGLGTSSLYKGQGIRREDADALTNGKYYQIIVCGSCNAANFSKDCIAERFLNNPNGGTVAFIGNTDVGWSDEYSQLRKFLDALYDTPNHPSDGRYDIGNAFQKALGLMNDTSNWRLHLLGDPEMQVWTDVPKNLQLSLIREFPDRLVVNLSGLASGDEALICVRKGDEIYAVETVTSNGRYTFLVFSPETPGDITVTATAHNYIPAESIYDEEISEESNIHIADIVINDTDGNNTQGNGDGQLDAGETVELTVSLKNTGKTTAANVVGTLQGARYISFLNNQSSFGSIAPGETKNSQLKYRIKVDKNAEEVLKNDLNPARFRLEIGYTGGSSMQEFNMDIFAADLRQGNKVINVTTGNGDLVPEAGESVIFQPSLFNAGKAQAVGLKGKITVDASSASYITMLADSVGYPDAGKYQTVSPMGVFQLITSSSYRVGQAINLILHVTDRYGKTYDFPFNLIEKPSPVNVSNFAFTAGETEIELVWTPDLSVEGYNIYRASGTADSSVFSNYKKVNIYPVSAAFFRDKRLDKSTRYYYRIKAVTASGNEGDFSPALTAWTSYPAKGLFPIKMGRGNRMIGSVIATDIDNDGNKEIFTVVSDGDYSAYGAIIGLHHDGIELFDIDGNMTSKSGFATFTSPLGATPAVAPLDNSGRYRVVVPTRNIENVSANMLACYAVEDNDGDHLPDSIWQKNGYGSAPRGAVIANVDNSSDGSNEIVLVSGNTLRVLNNTGTQVASKGSAFSFSAPAVADLDNDGYKEIIATDAENLYIWKNVMGTNCSLQSIFTKSGYNFISSPVICDLDNDGTKEILITVKKSSDAEARSIVYALKPNGTQLSGWNGTQTATYTNNWYSHDLSVGDLDGDGNLEVVILGKDTVKVWRNNGTLLSATAVPGLSPGKNVPILADVDGNPGAEIIFGSATQNYIYALDINGNLVPGFPMQVDELMESSVCVADVDNNGKNDLIAATGGFIYMWETNGTSDNIQWGMERADNGNTGEYKPACPPEVITGNTVWNGSREQCGNLTVQSGTLTLTAGCTLRMTGSSVITVRNGATLAVEGGTVENADIKVQSGGTVLLKNNGIIKLRDKGAFFSEKGGIFKNIYGKIDVLKTEP